MLSDKRFLLRNTHGSCDHHMTYRWCILGGVCWTAAQTRSWSARWASESPTPSSPGEYPPAEAPLYCPPDHLGSFQRCYQNSPTRLKRRRGLAWYGRRTAGPCSLRTWERGCPAWGSCAGCGARLLPVPRLGPWGWWRRDGRRRPPSDGWCEWSHLPPSDAHQDQLRPRILWHLQ